MRGKAKLASDAIDQLMDAVYEWEAKADAFVATGSDEDDVVVTHDSAGRLIEASPRPGLAQELTLGEFEERVNEAIRGNVVRAQAGLDVIGAEFREKCRLIAASVGQHPVGDELVEALTSGGVRDNSPS